MAKAVITVRTMKNPPENGAKVILTTGCWVDIAFYNAKRGVFIGEENTPASDVLTWIPLQEFADVMETAVKA